jgi:hypothetical protein
MNFKRAMVYGDSFVAPWHGLSEEHCWVNRLVKNNNIHVTNKAVRSSSAEYAIKLFYQDLTSNTLQGDELIVISLAHPGRLHLQYQNEYPNTASLYSMDNKIDKHEWFIENKEHLKWYLTNVDDDLLAINHASYVHVLNDYALANPSCKILLMSGWPLMINFPITYADNLLKVNLPLMQISELEIKSPLTYSDWTANTRIDPRINHMSNQNLSIFVNLISNAMQTNDTSFIGLDKFAGDIFTEPLIYENYRKFVDTGILTESNKILKRFDK